MGARAVSWNLKGSYVEICPCELMCPDLTAAFTAARDRLELVALLLALAGLG